MTGLIIPGDNRLVLPTLKLERPAQCAVTSPPYLKQRVYGDDPAELGREETLEEYVDNLVDVFRLVRPHLHPTGLLWLNIGDKANGSGGAGGDWRAKHRRLSATPANGPGRFVDKAYYERGYLDVPGAVVRALILDRWRLRATVVWNKRREQPEDLLHVRRPRPSHEMIYMLSPGAPAKKRTDPKTRFFPSMLEETGTVWTFPPGAAKEADPHLAPFPDELARRCILPSTLPGDIVLDPFSGSGTTVRVAQQYGRHGVGIELYAEGAVATAPDTEEAV